MANWSKTISEGIRVQGPSYTNKWGSFLWGQKWGDQQDPAFILGKNLLESITQTDLIAKRITRFWADTASFDDDTIQIYLRDGAGYYYEFSDRVINADQRASGSWTRETSTSTTWTRASATASTWGEV